MFVVPFAAKPLYIVASKVRDLPLGFAKEFIILSQVSFVAIQFHYISHGVVAAAFVHCGAEADGLFLPPP